MSLDVRIIDGIFSVKTITSVRDEDRPQTLEIPCFEVTLRIKLTELISETILLKKRCYKYIEERFKEWLAVSKNVTLAHAYLDSLTVYGVKMHENTLTGWQELERIQVDDSSYKVQRDNKFFSLPFATVDIYRADEVKEVDPEIKKDHVMLQIFRENGMIVVTPMNATNSKELSLEFDIFMTFTLGRLGVVEPWCDVFKADNRAAEAA